MEKLKTFVSTLIFSNMFYNINPATNGTFCSKQFITVSILEIIF